MSGRICAVIPSCNHHGALPEIVARLRGYGLAVYIVDDGSDEPAAGEIGRLADPGNGIVVARLPVNRGKGSAVFEGLRQAAAAGYTHAFQIDADGQHDLASVPQFLARSVARPDAVVNGRPVYDSSVPRARKLGRDFTHFWVRIETLSSEIRDAMCGFRIYPIAPAMEVLMHEPVGRRMDFDIEILVRLYWRGIAVIDEPVAVTYPAGNLSNFDTLRDNARITWMHTRLVFGMLGRLPRLLRRRRAGRAGGEAVPGRHWSSLTERGAYSGLWIAARLYRLLGRRGCLAVLSPVIVYFYATGREQRRASHGYLTRVFAHFGCTRSPGWRDGYRHFMSFAGRTVDSFAAWTGDLTAEAVDHAPGSAIHEAVADSRGSLFIVSHLGNAELSRALLAPKGGKRLTVLVHTTHAANYNDILSRFNPEASINTVPVGRIGPDTVIALRDRIENGEWVVIAGDRTPLGGGERIARVPFLGADAPFAHGPIILAALLGCPVYTLFCLRDRGRYTVYFDRFADRIVLPRSDREGAIRSYLVRYADILERYASKAPYQWYNFFDYWSQDRQD